MIDDANAVPKTHPASREMLPDDPLEMFGLQVPGDQELMLRLLIEEYSRIGWGVDDILRLARDPNYVAFHGLWKQYGEGELRRLVADVLSRCGVIRVAVSESVPLSERLVQIDLPT